MSDSRSSTSRSMAGSGQGSGGVVHSGPPSTLSPLPPPPKDRRGGYAWTYVFVGVIWVGILALTGWGWLDLFGEPTAAGGWWFVTQLFVFTPACLFLGVLACALVALFRRLGARKWPGVLQALPAVVVSFGVASTVVTLLLRNRMG